MSRIPSLYVLKFGGTSVATANHRATLARTVAARAQAGHEVVVVISALAGVTNHLSALAEGHADAEVTLQALSEIHHRELKTLLPELREAAGGAVERRLRHLADRLDGPLGSQRHEILATGERLALPLVAATLRGAGLEPRAFDGAELVTVQENGEIDPDATRSRLHTRFRPHRAGRVTVVTGFVARNRRGATRTLGRGASDLSATLLARLLDAHKVEIWSDVDGVLEASPLDVPEARPLPCLSFHQAATLAHFGAWVLHPRALAPLLEANIPLVVRNTANPLSPGTTLDTAGPECTPTAFASAGPVSWFRFRLPWYRCRSGRLLDELEATLGPPLHIEWPTASGPAQLLVDQKHSAGAARILRRHLGRDNPPEQRDNIAAIALTGSHLEGATLLQKGATLLQNQGISLRQRLPLDGGNALLLLVPAEQRQRAVRALYDAWLSSSEEHIAPAA